MSLFNVPPIVIECGQAWSKDWAITLNGAALDLSAWTGRFAIAESDDGPAIVSDVPTLTAGGLIMANLTAAETLLLQPYDCACLVFQVDIDPNDLSPGHRLQGKVKTNPEIT